jgi:hypothetical protein
MNGGDGGESGAALGIATSKSSGQWASFASETWWAPQMVRTGWQRHRTEGDWVGNRVQVVTTIFSL